MRALSLQDAILFAVGAVAMSAVVAIGGCQSTGQIATNASNFSATTTNAVVCATATTAKATLALSATDMAVINAALAACTASNQGQSINDISTAPAILAAVAILQQASFKL